MLRKNGKKMRSKLDPRGRTGIFVGYADDHAGNVYRFINTQTKKIILSRDVQWLNSFWKEYKKRKDDSRNLVDVFHSLEEDEQTQEESEVEEPNEQEIAETNDGNNTEEQKRLGIDIQMIGAREKELGRTRSQTREMERAELTMEDWIQETCFISAVTSGPTEPKTFQEAWHSPIEEERNKWQAAIRKEIRSMINRGVWRKIDKMKIPENRRLIGNKWVFKIKRDGTYRARLVALGYSQIPGVDFTDNFAPVAHDVSFRIALARMMVEKLDSLVMDVETAFLYGDIEEEIFMKSPVGMEEIDPGSSPEDCFQLKKGIYGLCQAARQFWKKFVETIKKEPFGFTVSQADPCMLFKENNLGICIIIMYVDDMLVIGKKEQIQEFATMIQKEFSVKIQHNLADYLGCEFHMNKERTKGWLGQPSIIKSLEQKFGEKAMKTRSSLTPGTPRFIARRVENEEDKVNAQDHETYRSGVGTLLYLTKHSRPDISNPVRELSKTMDAPAPARENERNSNFGNWLDLGDNSVCEECAMICTDIYSTDGSEGMIVYGDQGISSENYDEETYGDLLNTDSDDEQVIKYDVALLATDSVSLEKKQRRLNRDIPSEAPNHLSQLNEDSDTKQGLTTQDEEIESQEAWTMEMPSIDGDISMTNPSEQQRIEDKNKQFLYARAMHASHMIQHHMQGISERQRVIDEYRAMMDAGREMIPLDSDLHQNDPVIIQHIMQMIDTDIFWYGETFREDITELRKKALHETTMLTGEKLDENAYRKSAMMCWESLDESEPTSKKRKTLCQEEATNDPSDKIDDDPHTQRTANKGVGSIIPVNDLQLGTDDDASTLATQETLAKNLVYVTNIPDGKLAHTDIA